jgi:hypothetical protein
MRGSRVRRREADRYLRVSGLQQLRRHAIWFQGSQGLPVTAVDRVQVFAGAGRVQAVARESTVDAECRRWRQVISL